MGGDYKMNDSLLEISETEKKTSDILVELSQIRRNKKITQKELSNRTGIPQNKISNYENLRVFPRLDTLIKILTALDVKLQFD